MKLTIRQRLRVSNTIVLIFAGLVGLIGYLAVQSLDRSMDAIGVNGAAITDQLQADMMHDALRADVLGALQASTPDQHQSVRRDTDEHAGRFRTHLDAID